MGELKDGLYKVDFKKISKPGDQIYRGNCQTHTEYISICNRNIFIVSKELLFKWYARLGHSALQTHHVLDKNNISFIHDAEKFCEACKLGKMHKLPFDVRNNRASKPLELILSDLWGQSPTLSITSSSEINSCRGGRAPLHYLTGLQGDH